MRAKNRGQVVLFALVFTGILGISVGSLVSYTVLEAHAERTSVASAQALALAEAGFDEAVYSLNANGSYSGETNTSLPTGTFITSVANISSNIDRITSTGYVPNATSPSAVRTIEATASINTSIVSFNSGVQVGDGGLVMNNGSEVFGNLASNGPVSGGGTITNSVVVSGPAQASLDQSCTVQNSSFNIGDTSIRGAVAQSFVPSYSGRLTQIGLNIQSV